MSIRVFIDGANFYHSIKTLGFKVDYDRLRSWLEGRFGLPLEVRYYTAYDDEATWMHRLLDYLRHNDYIVIDKMARAVGDSMKGNMDVEITWDIATLAQPGDTVVLFSGDGDFRYVIDRLRLRGCPVYVISTTTGPENWPICSTELRLVADHFLDFTDLEHSIVYQGD